MNMRWLCHIFSAIVLVGLSSPAFGQDPSPSKTGFAIEHKVPFVEETWADASLRPAVSTRIPVTEIPRHRIPPKEIRGYLPPRFDNTGRIPYRAPQSPSRAPGLKNSFAGLGDDNSRYPPDTMGAAGPQHLMEVLNTQVAIFDKATGNVIAGTQISLDNFWASLVPQTGPFFASNSRVLYDQQRGCFIVTSLGRDYDTSGLEPQPVSHTSWLFIAVSLTSDPTGTWHKFAIDADKDNGQQTDTFAVFPGMGVDARNVYVTATMFQEPTGPVQYPKIWVISKFPLFQRDGIITATEIINPYSGESPISYDVQPAHVFGSSDVHYIIESDVFYLQEPDRRFLRLGRISDTGSRATFTSIGLVEVNFYSFNLPDAPQLGTITRIYTKDGTTDESTSLLNAVLRNGKLWVVHSVGSDDSTRSEVAWYEIDPNAASKDNPVMASRQGRIGDSDRFYYYPSIAVNKNGDVAIGFSGSSATEYVGAYYTAHESTGADLAVSLVKGGEAPYAKGGSPSRWGRYSATCVDPTDDFTFWTLQEYAATPDPSYDRWGTYWGKFTVRETVRKDRRGGGSCAVVPGATPADPGGYFLPFLGLALYLLLKKRAAVRPAGN